MPTHLGGGENFLSPYNLMVKTMLALWRAVTIYHCPVTTHLGGGEEVIVSFLYAPSL